MSKPRPRRIVGVALAATMLTIAAEQSAAAACLVADELNVSAEQQGDTFSVSISSPKAARFLAGARSAIAAVQ